MKPLTIEQRDEIETEYLEFHNDLGVHPYFVDYLYANTGESKAMWNCPRCGHEHKLDVLSCPNCNHRQPKQESNWKPMDTEKDIDRLEEPKQEIKSKE